MTIVAPELVGHLRANPQVRVATSAYSRAFVQAFFRDGLSQALAMAIAAEARDAAFAEQRAAQEAVADQMDAATRPHTS
ncbi:MAG: hypothetical protein M3069_28040 [Chloroflexota bacterium]|nr:hypothetical protein [Chloroflexota bacterium]